MHGLTQIHIQNFRACKNVSLSLGDFTPLVGQNNVGKSTVLDAIRMVLAPKAFVKNDASDPALPIVLSARISGITPELIALIPEPRHRLAIEPYCVNGELWVRTTGTGTSKPVQEIWQPDEKDANGIPTNWRTYPTGLPSVVSALLPEALHIQAMDDVPEDLGKGKAGSTIRGLLDEIMTPILTAHVEVTQALEAVRRILRVDGDQRSPVLAGFDNNATAALGEFFPGLRLDLDVPSIDIKEFFKSGDLHVTDEASGDRRRFDQVGSGAQRAIQMALIRLLADLRQITDPGISRRMLLIDEPELFLHPQGVRKLREALKQLSVAGFQVVFTTHSPLMLSRDNAPDTVIVRRHPVDGSVVRAQLREAVAVAIEEAQAQSRTLFELGNVADIYFAEKVILCEGKTDQRLLPLVYERIYGSRPELDRICFVALGSCSSIPKGVSVLSAMGITCGVIADLDFAFTHARSGAEPWLLKDGEDIVKVKGVLARVGAEHGVPLGGNGLPVNASGYRAADTWALFAQDAEGLKLAEAVHHELLTRTTWVWPIGCIEDVFGIHEKGEEAILEQEDFLRSADGASTEARAPLLKACLEWLRAID